MSTTVFCFRRDLRLHDNPALQAALAHADHIAFCYVLTDDHLTQAPNRLAYLVASLRALDDALDGQLWLRSGNFNDEILAVATEVGANQVHLCHDYRPEVSDEQLTEMLAHKGIELVRTGSPYAVAPGRIVKNDNTPYKVFTPFYRTWLEHGWRLPPGKPENITPVQAPRKKWPSAGKPLVPAGEDAARARWHDFLTNKLHEYPEARDRPGYSGTSHASVALNFGELHPRTLLADISKKRSEGAHVMRRELAWREFYADVLFRAPETVNVSLDSVASKVQTDSGAHADKIFALWQEGKTGYPIVDAGMRQLAHTGWMHNRVRMIVASFLVKDLHVPWQWGAEHFMDLLLDGDPASNSHNWQWVAGTGTDAAPYIRVFNPTLQSKKFDPEGDYIRTHVPELAEMEGKYLHEPWRHPDGPPSGYPAPIVDHAEERREALQRFEAARTS